MENIRCVSCANRSQCFFGGLSDDESDFLAHHKKEVFFKAGETFYKQSTSSQYLIFLLSGMAKVSIEGDDHKSFILQLVKPFAFLDFPAIFDHDQLYRSSVAVIDSVACLVDMEAFKSIVMSNKTHFPNLIRYFNQIQHHYTSRMVNVLYKNMEARIADAILYLVNEVYYSRSFRLDLSRKDMAELAGMSKESTSRILSQLKDQEIIRLKGKQMEVLDKKYLEQLSRLG